MHGECVARIGPVAVTREELAAIKTWAKDPEYFTDWSPQWPIKSPSLKLPECWGQAVARHNEEVLKYIRTCSWSAEEQARKRKQLNLDKLGTAFAKERERVEAENKTLINAMVTKRMSDPNC